MSILTRQWADYYYVAENCDKLELEIEEVYVSIKKKDGLLTIAAHPLQAGVKNNCLGSIKTKLTGDSDMDHNKNYPTLKGD